MDAIAFTQPKPAVIAALSAAAGSLRRPIRARALDTDRGPGRVVWSAPLFWEGGSGWGAVRRACDHERQPERSWKFRVSTAQRSGFSVRQA